MKISEYVIEFEKRYNKAKLYDMKVHDGVLAYRFLKSSDISESHQQLVKATLGDMTYANMKKQLSKVFMDTASSDLSSNSNYQPVVKVEHSCSSQQNVNDTYYVPQNNSHNS